MTGRNVVEQVRSKLAASRRRSIDAIAKLSTHLQLGTAPVVIMYHDVSERTGPEYGPWNYSVTPSEFEEHVEALTRHRTIVPFDDLAAWLTGKGSLPHDAVVLTFDDGYDSVLNEALPVLEAYDAPATVYVSTGLMERDVAPFEYRLATTLGAVDSVTVNLPNLELAEQNVTDESKTSIYRRLRQYGKHCPPETRDRLLAQLGEVEGETRILDPSQVKTLDESPLITIGSHGDEHVPLPILQTEPLQKAVLQSKYKLEQLLGHSITHFSYPYGAWDDDVRSSVEKANFETAVTTSPRPITKIDAQRPFAIPRIDATALSSNRCQLQP